MNGPTLLLCRPALITSCSLPNSGMAKDTHPHPLTHPTFPIW